jgi:protein gp37
MDGFGEPGEAMTAYGNKKVNAIGWCEKTWNVVVGCSRVSAGCNNCYAIVETRRMSGNPNCGEPYQPLVQISNGRLDFTGKLHFFEDRLDLPLRVKRPTVWFVNSLSDMYHRNLPDDTIKKIFAVMNKAHWHTFQILTKRADRMLEIAPELEWTPNIWQGVTFEGVPDNMPDGQRRNVLGRIPALRKHPAAVKFISFEPLVGPIPADTRLDGVDWCFFGGESHYSPSKARLMDLRWLRWGLALSSAFGVKPHVKQLGSHWALASKTYPPRGVDRHLWGKYRMGKISDVWPPDLRPYAIDSMREVTPKALAESLVGCTVAS